MAEIVEYQKAEKKVIDFLSNELALLPGKLAVNSRFRQDMGVDGADAADIIEAFSLMFDVNIDGFRINDYFGEGAGIHPAFAFVLSIFGNSKTQKTLRVSDLVKATRTGFL